MKLRLLPIIGLALLPLGAHAAEKLRVVTSIETLKSLTEAVGGDEVDAQSLSHGYQDPHFVEAKPSYVVTLSRADLLIHVGLELEIGWLPNLVVGSRNAKIQPGESGNLDISTAIDVMEVPKVKVDRGMGDIHPRGNPHFWVPPVQGLKIARAITERLKELRPEKAAYFAARFADFVTELKRRAPAWSAQSAKLKGLKVVTYHKSWVYVSSWLGIDEIGYVENKPGIQPDPQHLAQLVNLMKAENVKIILIEDFYNRGTADMIADHAGARVLEMPSDVGATPDIKTYFDLVGAVLSRLTNAVAQAG